jgi:hypothetical protein
MAPDSCSSCGAVQRIKSKIAGLCAYCGGRLTGGGRSLPSTPASQTDDAEKNRTRLWGGLQFAAGAILVVILVSAGKPRFVGMFLAGMLAAHGLFRLVFASGRG